VAGPCEHGDETSGFIKRDKLLDQRSYRNLSQNSLPHEFSVTLSHFCGCWSAGNFNKCLMRKQVRFFS
jgi:hypothetical protein